MTGSRIAGPEQWWWTRQRAGRRDEARLRLGKETTQDKLWREEEELAVAVREADGGALKAEAVLRTVEAIG